MLLKVVLLALISDAPAKPPPGPIAENSERKALGLFVGGPVQNDTDLFSWIPKPYFFYSNRNPNWSTTNILGGVFNASTLSFSVLRPSLFWDIELGTLFVFAGDRPRIDGENLKNYEFSGHRISGSSGPHIRLSSFFGNLKLKLHYHLDYLYFYDDPNDATFLRPDFSWEHGPQLALEKPAGPPTELFDFGVKPNFSVGARWRDQTRSWGVLGSEKKVKHYFVSLAGVQAAIPLNKKYVAVAKFHSGWVSNGDRLNALQEGTSRRNVVSIAPENIKADRLLHGELGYRWYPQSPLWAIRPFYHWHWYRELTPTAKRTDFAQGLGLKAAIRLKDDWFLDVVTGFTSGNRNDTPAIYELRATTTIAF